MSPRPQVIVRRPVEYNETGWPSHGEPLLVNKVQSSSGRAPERAVTAWTDASCLRSKLAVPSAAPCPAQGDRVMLTGDPTVEASASVLPVNWPGFADVRLGRPAGVKDFHRG